MSQRFLERFHEEKAIKDPEWMNKALQPFNEELSGRLNEHNFKQEVYLDDLTVDPTFAAKYTEFENTFYNCTSVEYTTSETFSGSSRWIELENYALAYTSEGNNVYISYSLDWSKNSVLLQPGCMFILFIDGVPYTPSLVGTGELNQDIVTSSPSNTLVTNSNDLYYGVQTLSTPHQRDAILLEALLFLPEGLHTIVPALYAVVNKDSGGWLSANTIRKGHGFCLGLKK